MCLFCQIILANLIFKRTAKAYRVICQVYFEFHILKRNKSLNITL